MLIQPDKNELGDARLDWTEGVAKAKEDNLSKSAQYKIPDQKLLEDQEMARGWEMEWSELIRRIVKLNRAINFDKGGIPGAVAVRVIKKNDDGTEEKEYVTGFYQDKLPEYSSVVIDENGLPTQEIRGWRSVLLALIRAKALTETQVEVTFGPATGQRASLWERSLQAQRG